jgi:predicted DCC family thiol-disulfide oxidoreductase YuxK
LSIPGGVTAGLAAGRSVRYNEAMSGEIAFPLTVFYDGGCPVCSREIDRYHRMSSGDKLVFVDISDPAFDPKRYDRTLEEFMAEMHAMDADGRFYRGVDAFRALWQGLPVSLYGVMGDLLGLPGIHLLARIGYRVFARLRRLLPRLDKSCDDHCHPGRGK